MREVTSDMRTTPDWARDLDRRCMTLILICWLVYAGWQVFAGWNQIRWLSPGDTDDNMRLAQVRAWLDGQSWYDLRQYRLNPPAGFDIHWSRLVDLPLAGLILFIRLFTTDSWAERLACGIAPLLPLSVALLGLGATVRRLVHPLAWPLAVAILFCAVAPMQMFAPERIDHHAERPTPASPTADGRFGARRRPPDRKRPARPAAPPRTPYRHHAPRPQRHRLPGRRGRAADAQRGRHPGA